KAGGSWWRKSSNWSIAAQAEDVDRRPERGTTFNEPGITLQAGSWTGAVMRDANFHRHSRVKSRLLRQVKLLHHHLHPNMPYLPRADNFATERRVEEIHEHRRAGQVEIELRVAADGGAADALKVIAARETLDHARDVRHAQGANGVGAVEAVVQ